MVPIYVALDLETTGLDPAKEEIIEVGAVRFDGERELDSFATLINPGRSIPPHITELTGISDRDVLTAPAFAAVRERLGKFVGDAVLVGHNVRFDLGFLHRQGCLRRHPYIDTLELATILMPHEPRYGLARLAERLGIEPGTAHRGLDDARTTMQLLHALQACAAGLPTETLRRITRAARPHRWPVKAIFEEAEQRRTGVAPSRVETGAGAPPAASELWRTDEPLVPVDDRTALDLLRLTRMLEPGGAFEQAFPGFEYRPQQVEMMQAVADALNHSRHLIVEAGTGTGKSVAYLLPAVHWAVQNRERVVVSTNTINLQDQLYEKDIPDLRALLSFDVRATILKGRSNYLCPRRLDALQSRDELTLDELRVLVKVLVWLPSTVTGDRSELSMYGPREQAVWSRISSDADLCTADRCWYRRQGECYYQRARRAAESAHIVVVNHALLLSDVATENRVLPQHGYLIVDEAHHLEDATTHQLGYSISRWGVESLVAQVGLGEGSFGGFVSQVKTYCQGRVPDGDLAELADEIALVRECNELAVRGLNDLFADLAAFINEYRDTPGQYDYRVRLTRDLRIQPEWERVELAWDGLSERLHASQAALLRVVGVLQDWEGLNIPGYEGLVQDGMGLLSQLEAITQQMASVLIEPGSNDVTWVQARAKTDEIYLCAVPLRVGHLIEQHLLWPKESVVLTSATLRTGGDFQFVKERLGAVDADEVTVGSPFDYEAQVLLYLPTDIPEPNEPGFQRQLNQGLVELAIATEGRMLVLFTSYSQLKATNNAINHSLGQHDITVYAQGQGTSRSQLLDGFRSTPRAVLLGTRSFWEGVDVPGEALSCLVLTKLPFAVPSDPVFAARSTEMDEPFYQYAVPDAVLRFRQGFGRLIRARTDRGVVVVMDRRLQSKAYGQLFIASLPPCTTVRGPLADLPGYAARWIEVGTAPVEGKGDVSRVSEGELEYVSFDDL